MHTTKCSMTRNGLQVHFPLKVVLWVDHILLFNGGGQGSSHDVHLFQPITFLLTEDIQSCPQTSLRLGKVDIYITLQIQ